MLLSGIQEEELYECVWSGGNELYEAVVQERLNPRNDQVYIEQTWKNCRKLFCYYFYGTLLIGRRYII